MTGSHSFYSLARALQPRPIAQESGPPRGPLSCLLHAPIEQERLFAFPYRRVAALTIGEYALYKDPLRDRIRYS